MKTGSLSSQIVRSMTAVALGVTAFVVVTSYVFYYVAFEYFWSAEPCEPTLFPTLPEWIWLGCTTAATLALAAVVASRLSRRILLPLNSVAGAIRRVAAGELGARAVAGDRSLGEASRLADDFNALAGQLQRMTGEQAFWNAAIAHELRTPITILRGRLQGLAEGVFPPAEAQFRSLLTQVEALNRLIEDLRVVSLAESGHLDLQWQDTDLAAEAEAVAGMFCESARSVGQAIEVRVARGKVRCDPLRMRQALLALLENARVHALPGTILVGGGASGDCCSLYVEDSGPGIPAAAAEEVFLAFHRLGSDRKGCGLGLAVVAAIARAHGGTAQYRASDRGGGRFELRWPPCR